MNRINVNLDVFEGPLDLLLQLIRINEVDITDIPIADITREYLEYIELMESLDFEIAGEFLIMAATLMRIKVRMLLPQSEADVEEDEWGDPRKELVERLLEYKKYKELSIHLGEKLEKFQNTFGRNFLMVPDNCKKGEIKIVESDLFGLLIAYKKILNKLSNRIPEEIEGEEFTIEDKQNLFLSKLRTGKLIRFSDFFLEVKSKTEIVVTVMAMLEMIRNGDLRVKQTDLFGEIYIYTAEPNETTAEFESDENLSNNIPNAEVEK